MLVSMLLAGIRYRRMEEIIRRLLELGGWPSRTSIHFSQSLASSQIGEKGKSALISKLEQIGMRIGSGEDAQPSWVNQASCSNRWICPLGEVTVFKCPGDKGVFHVHIQDQESARLVLILLRPANFS
jgi:hypothetical protein